MRRSVRVVFGFMLSLCIVASICVTNALASSSQLHPYTDVHGSYHEYVGYVYTNGIMTEKNPEEPTVFSPNSALTRAEVVSALYNAEKITAYQGRSVFSDVAPSDWCCASVQWAADEGIVFGYGDGTFVPGRAITRQELAVVLYRYTSLRQDASHTAHRTDLSGYTDAADIADWSSEAMSWAVAIGVLEETHTGYLQPNAYATRAQISKSLTVLFRDMLGVNVPPEGGREISISVYGKGTATLSGHNETFTTGTGTVLVETGENLSLTVEAEDGYYISYLAVGNDTPVYVGYNTDKKANYTDWDRYVHSLGIVNDNLDISIYLVQDGYDHLMLRGKSVGGGNYGGWVSYDVIEKMLAPQRVNFFFRYWNSGTVDAANRQVYFPGHCLGMTVGTGMINQPWLSGISAGSFNKNYTAAYDVKMADSSPAADGLTLSDFIDCIQMTNWSVDYRTRKLDTNAQWRELFKAIDEYQTYRTNPVYISLMQDGRESGHLIMVVGYEEIDASTVKLTIRDVNSGGGTFLVTKSGSGDYSTWTYSGASYMHYNKFNYITTSDITKLWDARYSKAAVAAKSGNSVMAYAGFRSGNLDLAIQSADGGKVNFADGVYSSSIAAARQIVDMTGVESDTALNDAFLYLPDGVYSVTNNRDEILTFGLADEYSSVTVEIPPHATASVSVSDTNLTENWVKLSGEGTQNFTAEFAFSQGVTDECQAMIMRGSFNGNAKLQKAAQDFSVVGVESLSVEKTDFAGTVKRGQSSSLAGKAATVSISTAAVTAGGEATMECMAAPTSLRLEDGWASWLAAPGASSYCVQLLKDGQPVTDWVETTSTVYLFEEAANASGNYNFAVYSKGDGVSTADSFVVYSTAMPGVGVYAATAGNLPINGLSALMSMSINLGYQSMVSIHEKAGVAVTEAADAYTIEIICNEGGAVAPGNSLQVAAGADQTITITPAEGYIIAALQIDAVPVAVAGEYTFQSVTENHSVTVEFAPAQTLPFADIGADSPYYAAVLYLHQNKLMDGTETGAFATEDAITLGAFATALYRLEGSPAVEAAAPIEGQIQDETSTALAWLVQKELLVGSSAEGKTAADNLMKEEILTMLWQYSTKKGINLENLGQNARSFVDYRTISVYAIRAVDWAAKASLIVPDETGAKLNLQTEVTRGEAAQLLLGISEQLGG